MAATSEPIAKTTKVDYSDVIILLSRQRSDTRALRSLLGAHSEISCFDESFNSAADVLPDSGQPKTNFFHFAAEYARGDHRRLLPDRHERLFLDFLEYLRCFSSTRYVAIDVQYDETHYVAGKVSNMTMPFLLDLIVRHGLRVLHVLRKKYPGDVASAAGIVKRRRQAGLENRHDEDLGLRKYLGPYEGYRAFEYENLFSRGGGGLAPAVLGSIAEWLSLLSDFEKRDEHFLEDEALEGRCGSAPHPSATV